MLAGVCPNTWKKIFCSVIYICVYYVLILLCLWLDSYLYIRYLYTYFILPISLFQTTWAIFPHQQNKYNPFYGFSE